jgi:hypothetical protein
MAERIDGAARIRKKASPQGAKPLANGSVSIPTMERYLFAGSS